MAVAKVSEKGWVVIPKDLRKKYGIKPGGKVNVIDVGERLYIIPVPDDPIAAGFGMLKSDDGRSWTEEIVEEHRREREREEAEITYWINPSGRKE